MISVKFPRESRIVVFEVELIFTLRNMHSNTSCLISKAYSVVVVPFAALFRDVKQRSPERTFGGALRHIPKDGCEGDQCIRFLAGNHGCKGKEVGVT